MNDLLLHPLARRLLGRLPIPLPEPLLRERGPCTERPLAGRVAVIGGAGTCAGAIADAILPAGGTIAGDPKPHALVFDATGLAGAGSLRALYDFFHPLAGRLARGGRAVVLAREGGDAVVAAACEGFTRSLAKELGRKGSTANLVRVAAGAEDRVATVLRFLLSKRAAFITAQPLVVTAEAKGSAGGAYVRGLAGKTALVTGAARGIGAATAKALADEGAKVILLDRPADAEALRGAAGAIGGTALEVDLAAENAGAKIAAALGDGLDVVVHNAGITRDRTIARMSEGEWDAVLEVNLLAAMRVHEAIEGKIREGGRIVGLSSVAGIAGNVGQTAYAASKAGMAAWARAIAPGLAARGITANAVAPGFIETRLTAAMPAAIRQAARRLSALSQGGEPEDVAQAIAFLASPGALGITGRTLRVCGGALVGA